MPRPVKPIPMNDEICQGPGQPSRCGAISINIALSVIAAAGAFLGAYFGGLNTIYQIALPCSTFVICLILSYFNIEPLLTNNEVRVACQKKYDNELPIAKLRELHQLAMKKMQSASSRDAMKQADSEREALEIRIEDKLIRANLLGIINA